MAAAAGGVILVGGGAVAVKYGTSLLNSSDSSKIKMWIDKNGKCNYERKGSSYRIYMKNQENGSATKELGTDNPCFQLSEGTLDWNKVEIDESRMDGEYKSVKTEQDFKSRITSSQNS